jgi:hypothetical protein
MDKVAAAFGAALAGNKEWLEGLASTTVPDSRRDILARVTHYAQK